MVALRARGRKEREGAPVAHPGETRGRCDPACALDAFTKGMGDLEHPLRALQMSARQRYGYGPVMEPARPAAAAPHGLR